MVNRTPKKIESLQNPIVKHLVKLKKERQYREEQKSAVVFGKVLIEELLKKIKAQAVYALEEEKEIKADFVVSRDILEKISGLSSPPSAVAEFPIPEPTRLEGKKYLLACDKIGDPGNLGTLIRSALAFGWEGIFLLNDSCDLFNDKVIRASRGGSFLLPYAIGDLQDLKKFSEKNNIPTYVADISGEDVGKMHKLQKGILLLGTERAGQSEMAKSLGQKVTIPISSEMESLNVAVAASILMYELK